MGGRLATIDMSQKWGCCAPIREQVGPHLTQFRLDEAYLHARWYPEPSSCLATRGGTSYEKVGGQKKSGREAPEKYLQLSPTIPVCPHPTVAEPGSTDPQ